MIGNAHDAALAATDPIDYLFSDFGCSRYVYLINDVIYKVNRNAYNSNADEFNAASLVKANLPEGFAVPDMSMYGNVLAMEYISGDPTGICTDMELGMECSHAQYDEVCMGLDINIEGWGDPSYGNAIIEYETGITYLIDLG